jgi:glycine/D-amino acid oxidase-like deaminating enzyme
VKDYRSYSFWLDEADDDLTPRPPLDGSIRVDVAILGAGFTGLWTAYHLLEREPSLRIAIVEAEIAGFGASGRNGGWCYSGFPLPLGKLVEKYGRDTAKAIQLAMYDSVDDVGRVCELEGIDAHYLKSGVLNLARAPHQLEGQQERMRVIRDLGLEHEYELLDADQTAEHVVVAKTLGSIWDKHSATIQPARLARGLARAVERKGATIYEQTRATGFVPGPLPRLDTERGNISAKSVVIAGEAYLAGLPQMRRQIIPLTSHIVVTEPLTDEQRSLIGWEQRELLGSWGIYGAYVNHTADGRIAWGAFRSNYPYGSKVTDAIDRDEEIFEHARRGTLDWFPMLRDIRFTHSWGGVYGRPRDHMPTMAYDRQTGIATAYGYTGSGVSTANLSGRLLADQITERETALTQLPMATHHSPDWEPEPLRWLGVRYVSWGVKKVTEETERTGQVPDRPTLKLAQRWFEW